MEQLEHFSHQHPLILNEHHAKEDVSCFGCNKSIVIGDSVYSCSISNTNDNRTEGGCENFFLHKTCAQLPQELEHPMHQNHRLSLRSRLQSNSCDACDNDCNWFTYRCTSCDFDLCLTCALQDRSFHHEAHNHPLTLMTMEATFSCHACDAEAKDLSYLCTTCLFWIHQSCASAPTTLECEFHKDHPLVLAYSLPEQFSHFRQGCSICKKTVRPNYWLYYCADCRFFAHIKCATSKETVQPLMLRSSENENKSEVDELNLVHFPMPDETSLRSLINQFVKDLILADDSSRPADQISHWAHPDHPLVLCDELLKQSNSEMKYDEMLCDGCVQPLSVDAFYGCVQCNFFLHRFCAELPDELKHPSHPQHKLRRSRIGNPARFFKCDFCKRCCNGIHFRCESCDFDVDIVCASLPSKIKHESHEHPLNQLQIPDSEFLVTEEKYSGIGFGCETCSFYLTKSGAINMPRTINHRWDPHPLHLMYPPVKGHPHEFDCEMCSEDINPNYWFYHCCHCDLSFHVGCLLRDDFYSNIKFGATVKFDNLHPHHLTFVQNKKKKASCGSCGTKDIFATPVLECAPCKFVICYYSCYRLHTKPLWYSG